jgi:hypothetical protein
MTEAEWLSCRTSIPHIMEYLRGGGRASDRKWRLFVCALARQVWPMLHSARSQKAVEVAERFADGMAPRREMIAAGASAQSACQPRRGKTWFACTTARFSAYSDAWDGAEWAIGDALDAGVTAPRKRTLLFDLFGNPFRPSPPLPPAVLAWNDRTVPRLAEVIYEDRQLPAGTLDTARLGILADALLDAGCDDEELIRHCRTEGAHIRGCWTVDLILGKS